MVDCIFCRSKKIFKAEGLDETEATLCALKYTKGEKKDDTEQRDSRR